MFFRYGIGAHSIPLMGKGNKLLHNVGAIRRLIPFILLQLGRLAAAQTARIPLLFLLLRLFATVAGS